MAQIIPIHRNVPKPPDLLKGEAERVWRLLAPEQYLKGHMEPLFLTAFTLLCHSLGDCLELKKLAREEPGQKIYKKMLRDSLKNLRTSAKSFFLDGDELLRRFGS